MVYSRLTPNQDSWVNDSDIVGLGKDCADVGNAIKRWMEGTKQSGEPNESVRAAIARLET